MLQLQCHGMQPVSDLPRARTAAPRWHTPRKVEGITEKRQPGGGKVYADLVRPPGLDDNLDQGVLTAPLQNVNETPGSLADGRGGVANVPPCPAAD